MALSKKQKQNAERLKKALEDYDETADALQTAAQLGAAAREGDEEELDRLSKKVQRRGWLK